MDEDDDEYEDDDDDDGNDDEISWFVNNCWFSVSRNLNQIKIKIRTVQ